MRVFKRTSNVNWKYIVGEILLIFIGINSAIWFNNWNGDRKVNQLKESAITKIIEEINNNIWVLHYSDSINSGLSRAYKDYSVFFDGNSSKIKIQPDSLLRLEQRHPGFFRVIDSTSVDGTLYTYRGSTVINFEIAELSDIAWETTKSLNIAGEFNYDCLYSLEAMYNLQHRLQGEINKATNAIQNSQIERLMSILNFINQLGPQLEDDYNEMLEQLKECE